MKSHKKWLSLALCLALLCALLPPISLTARAEIYSGFCGAEKEPWGPPGENMTWTLDTETGVLTIEGTGGMYNYWFEGSGPSAPWMYYNI